MFKSFRKSVTSVITAISQRVDFDFLGHVAVLAVLLVALFAHLAGN